MVHPHRHPHPGTQQACPLATAHPQGPVGAPTWAALPTPWWANYTIVRFIWSQKSTTIFCKSGSTSFHPGQRKSMLFPGSLSRPFLLCSTCLTGATICSKKRKARDQCKTTHTGDGSEKVYPQNNFKENKKAWILQRVSQSFQDKPQKNQRKKIAKNHLCMFYLL